VARFWRIVGPVARPELDPDKRKTDAVQLRLTQQDREVFDRLVDARRHELGPGVEVTDAGLLRWLFWKEATARGLQAPPTPAIAKPRAPQNRAPKKLKR